MAVAGVKIDDGTGGFASNCFPVRSSFGHTSSEASGAWLIAHHAEQRRRFKAVLCIKPRTYSRIKEERKKSEIQGTKLTQHAFDDAVDVDDEEQDSDEKVLDGFFLMKHCCVDDPSDLCSVNVAGNELTDVKEDDLALFDNVAYVNAGENFLPFEALRGFPALRELEIPLNGLRSLKIAHTDFTSLEMLDLSYNNLSQDDLLTLGLLTRLKVLHLTGNNLKNLPLDLAMPYLSREKQVRLQRFSCLEVLLLDDNKFMEMTVFAALAGLPKLRHLNMAKNEIFFVPQLKSVEGRVVTQDGKEKTRSRRPGSSRKSSRRSKSRNGKEAELVDLEAKVERSGTKISLTEQPLIEENSMDSEIAAETLKDSAKQESKAGQEVPNAANVDDQSSSLKQGMESDSEKPGTQGTGNSSFQDLMNEDFSIGDLSARINDLNADTELETENLNMNEKPFLKLPPFPELRYLNLASNKICEEDALLAIAAWPMLVELDIYDNPLTNEKSGDPPLLKRFLNERLGIKVNRKKPAQPGQPDVKNTKAEIRPRNIRVSEIVPKVPKLTLEEKMMLKLPAPQEPQAKDYSSSPLPPGGKNKSVLPPIPSTPKDEMTQAWAEKIIEEDEEEEEDEEDEDYYHGGQMGREASDTFFMTQVDDVGGDRPSTKPVKKQKAKEKPDGGSDIPKETPLDDRYKGYELLLDIEELGDEPELPPPSDIQGNIRALKLSLGHQLVYRDPAVELNKVKKMVQEYRRAPVPPPKPNKSYQEKVDDVLHTLKTRNTLEEEKLTTVLKDKKKFRRKFPDADDLLGKIQHRYNAVRVHSMRDVKVAKDITGSVLDMLPQPGVK